MQLPNAVLSESRKEKGESPPELLVGCKVLTTITTNDASPDSADSSKEAAEGEPSTPKAPTEIIGTVVSVGTWPGDLPGTSRTVKWDVSGEMQVVRWGAGGLYDVIHIQMKGPKISKRFPHPVHRLQRLVNGYFGTECNYGVILRLRRLRYSPVQGTGKVVGLFEIPDFGATIFVVGFEDSNGSIRIEERRLVSGVDHTGWTVRFGNRSWRPGTTYHLELPSGNPSCADRFSGSMTGSYTYDVTVGTASIPVTGTLALQRSRLFSFDEKNKPANIGITCDNMTVTKGKDGQALIYANVGFSSGIHYWEFKIDQNEQVGTDSIYIGTHSLAYSLTGLLTHSLPYSLTHLPTHSSTHSLKASPRNTAHPVIPPNSTPVGVGVDSSRIVSPFVAPQILRRKLRAFMASTSAPATW